MSQTRVVLIALAAGILLGILVAQSGSESLLAAVRLIEPLGTLWINAIRMTVIPLVVASLVAALASAPDARVVGRTGVAALIIFIVLLSGAALLTILAAPSLLAQLDIDAGSAARLRESATATGAAAAQTVLPGFRQWLVDLVPVNPVKSAVDGTLIPLIVFSVALGAAATRISSQSREVIAAFFRAVADAMLRLMQWILVLAPVGVFALALPLASRLGLSAAGAVAYYVVVVCALCVVVGILLYPIAVLVGRVPLRRFAQAAAGAQAVASTSRSSLASLPPMIAGAEERLGLNPTVVRFFLPLAASTFRITAVIVQITGALFLARLYGVDIPTATLLSIGLAAVLTSFSVPAIAGGSVIVMLPVLDKAGVPLEGVGILLGVDAIPDIFRTVVNVTAHMAGATIVARRADAPTTDVV